MEDFIFLVLIPSAILFIVWVIYSAQDVIPGVNEPGLYRKLKEQEENNNE